MTAPTKQRGTCIDGARLTAEMVARDLDDSVLAGLTGLDIHTIGRARRGERINQRSVRLISDALRRTPVDPLLAAMVGLAPDPEITS